MPAAKVHRRGRLHGFIVLAALVTGPKRIEEIQQEMKARLGYGLSWRRVEAVIHDAREAGFCVEQECARGRYRLASLTVSDESAEDEEPPLW